ncbi:MAG: M14 family metallopeptidase [Bacteroidales bacterium]
MKKLSFQSLLVLFPLIVFLFFSYNADGQNLKTPEQFFGFKPGADRMLFNYEKLIEYLTLLDEVSPKLKMKEIGKTPLGKPMYVGFVSSEKNLQQLEELKGINKKLALDTSLTDKEIEELSIKGKVFLMSTHSMHSNEVGPSQALPLEVYDMLALTDSKTENMLDQMVWMFVPNENPDGMDMVVEHYNKYKGTKYERSTMPGIYHKYTGHDNNRDFVLLTQQDIKNVARLYNTEWYPQVLVDKHQMGMDGTRYFVPPYHDPISENIEAELWNWSGIFGAQLMKDMTADGLKGVSQHVDFDNYWPGSTETSMWKNVVSFLTEAASTQYASPIFVEPNELSVDGKGLSEYKKSINMPLPWPGGWWTLGDIVAYEVSSMKSILATTAANKEKLLRFRNQMCKKQVELGKKQAPFFYVIPQNQHDRSELYSLLDLLKEHGIDLFKLKEDVQVEQQYFTKGDFIIPLAQPYRAFIKDVMEKQNYPLRHYTPGGEIIKPYDITSWSLPLSKGLKSFEINQNLPLFYDKIEEVHEYRDLQQDIPAEFNFIVLPSNENESFAVAFKALNNNQVVFRTDSDLISENQKIGKGSFILEKNSKTLELIKNISVKPVYLKDKNNITGAIVKMPRIAIIETWFHDMEGGWTRFFLDSYGIPFKVLRPGEIAATEIGKNFDIIIIPDNNKDILMLAKLKREDSYDEAKFPPGYAKGIGEEGILKIMSFVVDGGVVLAWGEAVNLFTGTLKIKHEKEVEEFKLPFENLAEQYEKKGLFVPGSLFKVNLTQNQPLVIGMENSAGIFYEGKGIYTTRIPNFDMDRRVIATFSENSLLLSGYAENYDKLGGKAAMVWLKKGKGQFVFYAFSPVYRAYTSGVYKLIFNALLMKKL